MAKSTERGCRFQSVLDAIARTSGSCQVLLARVLVVPLMEVKTLQETLTDANGKLPLNSKQMRTASLARYLPSDLNFIVAIRVSRPGPNFQLPLVNERYRYTAC